MKSLWFALGAFLAAGSIAAGALGAHALKRVLDAPALELWHTASHYLLVGGIGLLALGLAAAVRPAAGWPAAGWCLLAGTAVFSGTVGALALGAPRWLGAVTPVGGVLLIAGFVLLGVAALR